VATDKVPPPVTPDPLDGYVPVAHADAAIDLSEDPLVLESLQLWAEAEAKEAVRSGRVRMDTLENYRQELFDGYRNQLTGLGDPNRDKTFGGRLGGVDFLVRFINGNEAEDRWRGSDLGSRIVERIPNEMTRRGWTVQIQPSDDDPATADIGDPNEEHSRPASSLRLVDRRDLDPEGAADPAAAGVGAPVATAHEPGPLPQKNDRSTEIVEDLERRMRAMRAAQELRQALNYERAYGGGAVLIGADDGAADLTRPLDERNIKSVRHLTAYRGGWDGELIAWRYYNDPRKANFGKPEIYMLRNLGVPIASPPAPGEIDPVPQVLPTGPTGSLIFYVHESRLLVFDGRPVSRRAAVQMRGWGDSVFTRIEDVLSGYGQSWAGIVNILQEWAQGVLAIEGLAAMLATGDPKKQGLLRQRAIALQMAQSIAKTKLIDAKEKFTREVVPMSGIADIIRELTLRVAAAADMPVSLLMGQVQGGLGDASKGDIRFFYDQVESWQNENLLPQVTRLYRLLLLAKDGPTRGLEPKRWSVTMNPLWQMNDQEQAAYRKTITETDAINIDKGVVTPEEVAATRYGGNDFNDGPIVIDIEGRRAVRRPDPTHVTVGAAAPGGVGAAAAPAPPAKPAEVATEQPGIPADKADDLQAVDTEHAPGGSPEGGQFVAGSSSLTSATTSQLAVRIASLGRREGGNLSVHPEYKAIVKELRTRGIKSFPALERAVAAGK
jgi:phage-related protein (TIGR01555 family)